MNCLQLYNKVTSILVCALSNNCANSSCLLGTFFESCANWVRESGRGAVAKERLRKRKGSSGEEQQRKSAEPTIALTSVIRNSALAQVFNSKLGFPSGFEGDSCPRQPKHKRKRDATPSLSLRKDYPACLSLITPCKGPYGDNLWQVNNRSYLDYSSCKYLSWLCADSSWIETVSFHFRSWSNFQCN